MGDTDRSLEVTRRQVLRTGTVSLVAISIMPGGLIVGANNAWAAKAKSLKPETFATLVQMSRDIYPHDFVADKYYAGVVSGFDGAASKSSDDKKLFEDGVKQLNASAKSQYGAAYLDVKWEGQRVELLRSIEKNSFFQRVRGALIGGIYGNAEVWPLFGYEGPSFDKGGYIDRGFNDIDWL